MSITRIGSQARAERLARELLKTLDVGDLETLVTEGLDAEPLYNTVDPRYDRLKKENDEPWCPLRSAAGRLSKSTSFAEDAAERR
jgi:hypothetical protein